MAADKIINIRIDVTKINKAWLFKGEKGTYLDATVWFNNQQDDYQSNGMITQSVPKDVREAEKDKDKKDRSRGEILGNCRVFGGEARESVPGSENQPAKTAAPASGAVEPEEDLPF